jgi:hypothetical protein
MGGEEKMRVSMTKVGPRTARRIQIKNQKSRKNKMRMAAMLLGVCVVLAMVVPAFAVKPNGPAAYNGLNRGNDSVNHLELYEKDQTTWEPIEGGASGRLTFNKAKNTFVLNANGLEGSTDYALIRYKDPWPGENYIIARGSTNKDGNLHLSGNWEIWTDKIWVVLGADIDGDAGDMTMDVFNAWHGSEYLFEYNVLQ